MRVALVHSFYSSKQPSGENAVVKAEYEALSAAGVDVHLVRADTDQLEVSAGYRLRSAARVASGWGRNPSKELDSIRPDVVHVHNLFPNWSSRWIRQLGPPLVHTLHNYRPMCAAATLYRGGEVCTLCVEGDTRPAVRYACYRGSAAATLPLAVHNLGGVPRNPLLGSADRVITLCERMRNIYASQGVRDEALRVWPNFLPARLEPDAQVSDERSVKTRYLFVGRVSEEKGIARLVDRWPADGPDLDVVGDGPDLDGVGALAAGRANVTIHGRRDRREVLTAMREAAALVIPSLWFEGFPVIYAEALAAGLPVMTFEPCNVVELVTRDGTGGVLTWDAPLGEQLPTAAVLHAWSERCRPVFDAEYTEAAYVRRAISLYEELL